MTIINPNSISGISSITALNSTAAINLFKDDGTAANIITGITTGTNFKTGSSNLHNVGIEIAGINVLGADTPIGAGATIYNSGAAVFTGIVTATSFVGSGANLTSLPAQATIANNADNRVITGGSGVNLNGESTLTYGTTGQLTLTRASQSNVGLYVFHSDGNEVGHFGNIGTGNEGILALKDGGTDTIILNGSTGGNSYINSGNVGIGSAIPAAKLDVVGSLRADGSVRIDNSASPTLYLTSTSTTGSSRIFFGDPDSDLVGRMGYTHDGDYFTFYAGYGERFRIAGNGDITVTSIDNFATGPTLKLFHNSGSPAANDVVSRISMFGDDAAGNETEYGRIETVIDDPTNGQETAHIQFSTRGLSAYNSIFRLKNRSTASAPSYTADDINGIILDVYNTGNPYPRYMNFIAKSGGNTDSNIGFWTEAVGGSPTEKLRITSAGSLESYSTSDANPNFKFRSDDTNWHGYLNQTVHGSTISTILSCGGTWTVDGTTYAATKDYNGSFSTAALVVHNQYSGTSTGGELVFVTKANGSSTTDGAVTERLRISSNGDMRLGGGTPSTFGSGTTVLSTYNASTYTANLVTSGSTTLQMIASQTHGASSIGTRSNHNLNLCANDSTKMTITTDGTVNCQGTTALKVPTGTTAQRPTGSTGMLRYNTSTEELEAYGSNNFWFNVKDGKFQGEGDIGTASNPAYSGKQLKELGRSSGNYYIKPQGYSGSAIEAYVDMTTNGGGWVLVAAFPLTHSNLEMSSNTSGLNESSVKNYATTVPSNNSAAFYNKNFINYLFHQNANGDPYSTYSIGGVHGRAGNGYILWEVRANTSNRLSTIDAFTSIYKTNEVNNKFDVRYYQNTSSNTLNNYVGKDPSNFNSYANYTSGRAGTADGNGSYHYLIDDIAGGYQWAFRENYDDNPGNYQGYDLSNIFIR